MKKSALALLFSSLLFFLFFKPVFAQVNPYNAPNTNPDVPQNMHTYTQNVMIEVLSALNCQVSGIDIVSPNQDCLGVDRQSGKIGFVKNGGGAIGMMGSLIAATFTPPIHTSDYLAYMSRNFGISKPAYAQSPGQKSIAPLVKLWSVFRNVVYLVFVLAFVIIGLAIMLRVKIDPRTVMSIENQIPKFIIGLILVTFSFAIAGLLIDLMWVSIYLIFNLFTTPGAVGQEAFRKIGDAQVSFRTDNPIGFFNNLLGLTDVATNASGGVSSVVRGLFEASNQPNSQEGIFVLSGLKNMFDFATNTFGAFMSWIAGALALLIVSIALLWALFRIWFMLISAYVFILLDIITAPFWIVIGIVPGGGLGFSGWLRDFTANLISFPATIGMFLAGRAFMDALNEAPQSTTFFPPLIGNPGNQEVLSALIGLGIILLTPDINNILKKALKAPKLDISMIAKGLGAGAGAPGRVVGGTASTIFAPHTKLNKDTGATELVYPKGGLGRFLRGFGMVR